MHRRLEERYSIMESRLFQLENKNESMDCDIENVPLDKPLVEKLEADEVRQPLTKHTMRIDFGKTVTITRTRVEQI